MKIVLDANIIYGNWLLKGPNVALIEKYIQLNEIEIIVPEVIILEVINLYKRELEKHVLSIKKINHLPIKKELEVPDIEKNVEEYESLFRKRLSELKTVCSSHDDIPHSVIIRRALDCRKPFRESDKGYRDTLLWEVIRRKVASSEKTTFLITNNHEDFGSRKAKQILHQNLQQDLIESGLSMDCVKLHTSLKGFIDKEIRPRVKEVASTAIEALKNGEYETFSILPWFGQNRDKFVSSTNKWIEVVLSDKPELETPEVSYIENPERIEVTDVYSIDEDRVYLEAIAYADTVIDVFIFKSDFGWIDEKYDLCIWDSDWNEHYMWAQIIFRLPIRFTLTFNIINKEVEEFEINPIEEFYGWCVYCGHPILHDAAEHCPNCERSLIG